jgi:hypothetical protein
MRSLLGWRGLEVPLRVAVMGCVVNGPGEAREADLGVASGNGKGQIFVRGEVIKTVKRPTSSRLSSKRRCGSLTRWVNRCRLKTAFRWSAVPQVSVY